MKSKTNLASTVFKAITLATVVFWLFILSEESHYNITIFIFFSIIPISIVVFFSITVTIMPFFWGKNEKISKQNVFYKYFPYYSIIVFSICSFCVIISNFDFYVSSFCITAFITLMQSWIWLCKPKKRIHKLTENKLKVS